MRGVDQDLALALHLDLVRHTDERDALQALRTVPVAEYVPAPPPRPAVKKSLTKNLTSI